MSIESLPYTLLLLLAQFTAGVAALVLFVQLRRTFEPPFVRVCSWLTITGALLTMLASLAIEPKPLADAYELDAGVLDPVRGAATALFLFSLAHWYFLRRPEETFLATATGATSAASGVLLLVLLSSFLRLPAWSMAGVALMLFAGSLTIGAFSVAMIWGHWYLVKPSLDERPLNELALIALGAILFELLIVAMNASIPVGSPFDSNALLAVSLPQNPGFWLRVGVGLVFPGALAYMAYVSSKERSMMSATGLLYIAVGACLAGEALGRGLLFVTGSPV